MFLRFLLSLKAKLFCLSACLVFFYLVFNSTPEMIVEALRDGNGKLAGSGLAIIPGLSALRQFLLQSLSLLGGACTLGIILQTRITDLRELCGDVLQHTGVFVLLVMLLPCIVVPIAGIHEGLFHRQEISGFKEYKEWIGPEIDWMEENLSADDMVLTFEEWPYLMPGKIVRPDHPLLKTLYSPGVTLQQSVSLLRDFGVKYVYINEARNRNVKRNHPLGELFFASVLVRNLDNRQYFIKVLDIHYVRFDSRNRIYKIRE
jgi:hypothetical protein